MNLEPYRLYIAGAAVLSIPFVFGTWLYLDADTPIAITYQAYAAWLTISAIALLATRISAHKLAGITLIAGTAWWLAVIASRLFAQPGTGHALDTLTADLYLVLALLTVVNYALHPVERAAHVTIGVLTTSTLLFITWALLPSTVERDPSTLGIALAFQAVVVVIALMTHVLAKARSERDAAVTHAAKWRNLANLDDLTNLTNRRYLERALAREHALAQRHESPISVLYIDIDDFKSFNDKYGHPTGDDALAHMGAIMHQELRASDHYGRWGGEEFLVIAPDNDAKDALRLAERLRHAIATNPGPSPRTVTVSIGIATSPPCNSPDELVAKADQRLYEAKRLGRNRVVGPTTSSQPSGPRHSTARNPSD